MPEECRLILGMALPDHCFSGISRGRKSRGRTDESVWSGSREADSVYLDCIGMEVAGYEIPTLYTVDLLNMDTCRNKLLLEDVKEYGRKI